MTDHYRQALEGLRERCAQEAERITARRRVVFAMSNNEAMKPCNIAAAIRKIDVKQYYEGAAREIKALRKMERAKDEEIKRLRARVVELEKDAALGARVRKAVKRAHAHFGATHDRIIAGAVINHLAEEGGKR